MVIVRLTKKLKIQMLKEVIETLTNDVHLRGICYNLWLLDNNHSIKAVNKMFNWFATQKPSTVMHPQFTTHPAFYGGSWWWTSTEEGKEQRIAFLNHLIETLT